MRSTQKMEKAFVSPKDASILMTKICLMLPDLVEVPSESSEKKTIENRQGIRISNCGLPSQRHVRKHLHSQAYDTEMISVFLLICSQTTLR